MKTAILKVQSKGQVMLPKEWRTNISLYQAVKDDDMIFLIPVHLASKKDVLATASKVMKKNAKLLKSLADK
ncbi:hypothetical protein COV82_03215 [Candidatus Peregrinibacteria bacterium CG11_big_fil_rev_8_21_14_0_20_46_8]|nr:MAG: hypothetical protein COV82_03215 [Candidatus Peregrinibacteria bacterium CG11_big_fil_rev_8_21_14_0_20_46_8]